MGAEVYLWGRGWVGGDTGMGVDVYLWGRG